MSLAHDHRLEVLTFKTLPEYSGYSAHNGRLIRRYRMVKGRKYARPLRNIFKKLLDHVHLLGNCAIYLLKLSAGRAAKAPGSVLLRSCHPAVSWSIL
jgi:hypothetical protein